VGPGSIRDNAPALINLQRWDFSSHDPGDDLAQVG